MAIKHTYIDPLVKRQAEAEKAMLAEFHAGDYTIDNPLVKVNPYFINPLAAVVLFKTEEEVAVTVTVCGKEKEGNMKHTFPKAKEHVLPIVGLYGEYENTVIVELYRGRKTELKIQTGALPETVAKLNRMETTATYLRDELIIVCPALRSVMTGFDYKGDIRWTLNIPCVFDLKRVSNGNIILGTDRLLKMPYYMSGLYEMAMCGKIVKEYCIPGGNSC